MSSAPEPAAVQPPETDLILAARQHCRIVHHVPGRIRLRFDVLRLAPLLQGRIDVLERALRRVPGIRTTEVNLAASSLVVHYDPTRLAPASFERLVAGSPASAATLLNELLAA